MPLQSEHLTTKRITYVQIHLIHRCVTSTCEIVRPTEHFLVRNPPWTQWAPSLPGGDLGYRCLLQGPHREEQVQSECKKQQLQTHWHNLRCKHFASQLLSIPVQYGNKFLMWVRPCPQRYATLSDSDFITSCLKSNSGRHSPTRHTTNCSKHKRASTVVYRP